LSKIDARDDPKLKAPITSAPGEMTISEIWNAKKHLPVIVRLLNEEYRSSYEFIPFNEERVLSQIRKRNLEIFVSEANGKLLGLITTHEENLEEHILWLAAWKGQNRRTIENMLVKEIEKKAKGATISIMVDEGSPKISDWINRGYTLQPGFQRMSASLNSLKPIPQTAKDVKFRSLKPEEEEKLIAIVNTGFGWQRLGPGVLEKWKSEDPPFSEDWVHVAQIGERIVSAVVAKPDTDYIKYLHLKRGYLGPAATLPELRNRHLASALTARAMNFLFEEGMSSVRLATSEQNGSSIALLRNLGFQVDVIRKVLRKKLKSA
jgi:ribosomal protein S18 acetylase RimI-like enzyme